MKRPLHDSTANINYGASDPRADGSAVADRHVRLASDCQKALASSPVERVSVRPSHETYGIFATEK